jgi:hypothetical protein
MESGYKRRTAPLSSTFASGTVDGFAEASTRLDLQSRSVREEHYPFHRCGCVVYIVAYFESGAPASDAVE